MCLAIVLACCGRVLIFFYDLETWTFLGFRAFTRNPSGKIKEGMRFQFFTWLDSFKKALHSMILDSTLSSESISNTGRFILLR
jgi:hypothetical protein